MKNDNSVAVIGIGCRYPGASSPRQLWENILARRRQFRRMPDRRLPLADYHDPDHDAADKTYGTKAAVIDGFDFDWVSWRVPKTTFESTDIVHWLALDVAQSALQDAGYSKGSVPTERTGVILGNTLTGEQTRSQSMRLRWPFVRRTLLESARARGLPAHEAAELAGTMEELYKSAFAPITEDTLAGGLSNTIPGRICNFFDFHGGGYTVDGACSSSIIAVATAASALVQGDLDLALAGGVDISLDTFELIGFAKTGALSPTDMRVYDRKANGFIPGEGCGLVVLKRLEDARADGDYVYAVLSGWGLSSDGKGGITAPSGKGQSIALRRAFGRAPAWPGAVDFVEGHGTGTPVGDREELKGIAMALGDLGVTPLRPCGVTSIKSIIGHTKAAAGVAGFIKAVMAVNQRILPPTAGCAEPNPLFETEARQLYPVLQGEVRAPTSTLRAGVSAMGFGGINSHVTVESADAPTARLKPADSASLDERALMASAQETELFVLAAPSRAELTQHARRVRRMAEGMSEAEMVDLAARLAGALEPNASFRAAIVAASPNALRDSLDELEKMLLGSAPPQGRAVANQRTTVWIGNGCEAPRLGFLFPGQGSQKLNMARRLVERHAWARQLVEHASLALEAKSPAFASTSLAELIYRPLDRALDGEQAKAWAASLTRTEVAQPAICLASILWLRKLERLGLRPSVVGGHSLGELTALHAAGAFDAQVLIRLAGLRGEAMSVSDGQKGAMASFGCSVERAQTVLDGVDGYVVIANVNSPAQTVVSGEEAAVGKAMSLAKAKGIQVWPLAVSNAFHSRLVVAAAERLRAEAPVTESLGPLNLRLLSSTDGRELGPGLALREHLARQILARVDFVSMVRAMAEECDLLVEVGPGSVLTSLARAIVPDTRLCFAVESKAEADADLNGFLAGYFARGGNVIWEELYAGRLVRPFIPADEMVFIENQCERPFDTSRSMPSMQSSHSSHSSHSSPSMPSMPSMLEAPPAAPVIALPAAGPKAAIPDLLLGLVERRSGFPRSTLTMELRLLDDLNMDSIKAAELIAQAAGALGVAGEIDAAPLANASLQAIAEALARVATRGSIVQPVAQPVATVARAPIVLLKAAKRLAWVRDFSFDAVPEALPTLLVRGVPSELAESALILAEESEGDVAGALRYHLRQLGLEVTVRPFSLDQRDSQRFSTFIALLPRRPDASRSLGERLSSIVARLKAPIRGTSRTVVYVQFGGGFFGKGKGPWDVEQCCATALAASFHLERPELKVRALDFSPAVSPMALAERLCAELATPDAYAAVGFDGELVRRVRRPKVLEPASYASRSLSWSADDVVLVTGGAKGITAECALALAGDTGVRLALVGRSALDDDTRPNGSPSEARRALDRLREAGITARYYQCDVADFAAVQRLVRHVRDDLGRISGVVHGAGLNTPAAFERVSANEALAEISPKVLGAANLCRALEDDPPKLLVGLSSIIGLTGMTRNAWYGFSNEALGVLLAAFGDRHPETAVLLLAFSIWDEVGMGARMGSTAFLAKMGIDSIPVAEGVRRFLQLFHRDAGLREVVTTARVASLDTWAPGTLGKPESSRFLDEVISYVPGVEIAIRTRLTLERDPYLNDHVWRGTNLFPAVFGLEAMAQAVACVTGETRLEALRVEHVRLERPIAVSPDSGTSIEIWAEVLEQDGEPGARRVRAEIAVEQTGYTKAHFSAVFVLGALAETPVIDLSLPAEPLDIAPKRDLYGWLLFQGQAFQRIERVYALDSQKALVASRRDTSSLGGGSRLTGRLILGDAYFRDSMLQSVQLPLSKDLCLPVALDTIERFGSARELAESLFIVTTVDKKTDQEVSATICAVDADGRLLERITSRMRILEHHGEHPAPEEIAERRGPSGVTSPVGPELVSNLDGSNLDGSNLDGSNLDGSNLGGSNLAPTIDSDLGLDLASHRATIEWASDGRPILAVRFPITFREAANPSRTVHFSHYFSWLGRLRELLVAPVFGQLSELFSTGEWGMVTNAAETIIAGEARLGDVIEGRVWVDDVSGPDLSTVTMLFDWRKLMPAGEAELIATSTMSSTWVAMPSPGIVKVEPFPQFARAFLQKLLPQGAGARASRSSKDAMRLVDLGRELYCVRPGPTQAASLLREQVFETTLEDANLVGNIYFANYYAWQGRVRDQFLHDWFNKQSAQALVKEGLVKGELRCASCRINHLQEAMPFDQIVVSMHLKAVCERGARLAFDYFHLAPDGHRRKLGHGEQEVAWFEPAAGGPWKLAELPAALRASLVPEPVKPPRKYDAKREPHDAIIVGAGVGGLAAGALLAKRGRRIVVVEQHDKPGGFCTSWVRMVRNRKSGGNGPSLRFVLDAGVQDVLGLHPGGHVRRLLHELGLADEIEWRRVAHEYIQPGLRLKVPQSPEDFREELATRFPDERAGLSALFAEIDACNSAIYGQEVPARSKSALARWANTSFATMVKTYVRDQRLSQLLSVLTHYVGDDPNALNALSMCPVLAYYTHGGYYPLGGSQVFSDALVSALEKNRGELRLRTAASRIIVEQGRARGVQLADGSVLRADHVIANGDVRRTFLELVGREHLEEHFVQRVERLRLSCSAFMVFLGLDMIPEIEPLTAVLAEDGTATLVGTLSKLDPSLSPPGHSRVILTALIPNARAGEWNRGAPGYQARKRQFGDDLIRIAKQAIPDLEEHIVFRECASPATFARYAWTTDGAVYGPDAAEWHPSLKTPIQNLLIVGAGVAPRPGIEDAVRTALKVTDAIEERSSLEDLALERGEPTAVSQ